MTDDPPPNPALLPAGLRDVLPPEAETEAAAVEAMMAVFAAHGYQRVKPPLLEFEETLLAGTGGAVADQTFRLMDPASHRMMALRSDTTPQIARIATTRLADAPRPLRLSYAGQCLRVRATQLAPERQIAQAGIELIGADGPEADAELVLVAAEALAALGLARVSVDLTVPPLIPLVLDDAGFAEPTRNALARALDRKDAAAVQALAGRLASTLIDLLLAAGLAPGALAALRAASLPAPARAQAARLEATVAAIAARAPGLGLTGLTVTVDPVEFRGYRYHTGVCTTIYAAGEVPGRNEELGRGGRYLCGEAEEPAAGLTLYPDAVLRTAPRRKARRRVYLPPNTDPARARALRAEGYATVAALAAAEPMAEAARLDCAFVLLADQLQPVSGE